jgi:polyketide synthase 12/myxalamid-type polyketide synthase MxaB
MATEQPEDQVALRDAGARVPRIRAATVSPSAEVPRFDPAAAYLITGGLAGLGLRVARWMARNGAGQLILAARSEPSAATRQEIGQIEEAGTKVRVVRGDVADLAAVHEMIAAAGAVPLRGVMHAAGRTDDAALATLDWGRTERVMRAKIAGSWNLHLATAGMPLDHFVLFSSGAAFLGSPGQTNHAMANNYLGALAHQRRAQGLPALAVDWGPWAEVGAATRDGVLERARAAGLGAIDPEQGLEMLGRLMADGKVRVAAVPVNWGTYLSQVSAGAGRALFNGVRPSARASADPGVGEFPGGAETPAAVAAVPYLSVELSEAVAGRRSEVALDGVRMIAGRVLGAGAGTDIDPMTPLTELGLDSLMAVEMRNRLATALGQPLPATLLFNYPSLESLAGYVVERVHPPAEESHSAAFMPSLPASEGTDLDDLSEDEVADLLAAKLKDV